MKPRFQTIIPKCCPDESTLCAWLIAADNPRIKIPVCGFCTDCTPEYQSRMIEQNRCENTSVRFFKFDNEVIGLLL